MDKQQNIEELVRQLPIMERPQLAELWEVNFGRPPATRLRAELMRPILAFRIQERAYGGHSPETIRRLKQIAQSLRRDGGASSEAHVRFKSGTRLVREWGGKTYEVAISASGYEFEGKTYKSLSPIANQITGTRWSGPAFFGTKRAGAAK